jgi:hypothetical protein
MATVDWAEILNWVPLRAQAALRAEFPDYRQDTAQAGSGAGQPVHGQAEGSVERSSMS